MPSVEVKSVNNKDVSVEPLIVPKKVVVNVSQNGGVTEAELQAHITATDPHTQYIDPTELTAALTPINSQLTTLSNQISNHTQTASTITDFSEAVDDRVSGLIQPGSNVSVVYNDTANTFTISASAPVDLSQITYERTFNQFDLTILNKLPVIHNLGSYPSAVSITDNTGEPIFPDNWDNASVNSIAVDLNSFVPISGTWKISVGV